MNTLWPNSFDLWYKKDETFDMPKMIFTARMCQLTQIKNEIIAMAFAKGTGVGSKPPTVRSASGEQGQLVHAGNNNSLNMIPNIYLSQLSP